MFLLLTSFVMVRLPAVQTLLVKKISAYLSSELKTKVSIGSVHLELVKKIVLKNIYIEDQHHDTLLSAYLLKADISKLNRQEHTINLSGIDLQRARIKLQRYKTDDGLNIQFIIDYFSSAEADTTPARKWGLSAENLRLSDVRFSLHDHRYSDCLPVVNFSDLDIDNLQAHFTNIKIIDDSLFTEVKNISFREKSGFTLKQFIAHAKIAPDEMRFDNLDILTANSSVKTDLVFSYNTFDDFNHFLTKVNFNSEFLTSDVSSKDIAYFTSELIGFDRNILLSGLVRGTVEKFKAKNLTLNYGEQTVFKGNVNLEGLPDVSETFIDLVADNFTTAGKDIATIPVGKFTEHATLKLPAEIMRLGTVNFKGKFTGFYNDFVAYGNIHTELGYLTSDLNLKFEKTPSYSGHLKTYDFDIGKLFNSEKILGRLSMNVECKGTNFNLDKIAASVKGTVNSIDLFKYNYKNITLDGNLAKKLFNGSLAIEQNDLHLKFDGKVDLSKKIPQYDFNAAIKDARLANLNLIKRDSSSTLSVITEFHITGNTIDDMDGYIKLKQFEYTEGNHSIDADEIKLESDANGNEKSIRVTSDFADLDIRGYYRRSSAVKAFGNLLSRYLPSVEQKMVTVGENQNFTYSLKLKNTSPVLGMFLPSLKIDSNTVLSGNFNSLINDFSLRLNSDRVEYGDFKFNKVVVSGKTNANKFDVNLSVNEMNFHDSIAIREMLIAGETRKDSAFFNMDFTGKDSTFNHLHLNGNLDFTALRQTIIHLNPSDILIEGETWKVNDVNRIIIDTAFTQVNNLAFQSGIQKFGMEGKISADENDQLKFLLEKFDLHKLNKILNLYGVDIAGSADGKISIAGITHVPKISSDLAIADFAFFDDTLGTALMKVICNTRLQTIDVDATVNRNDIKNITVSGKYLIKQPHDELDFSVNIVKTNVQPFGHYLNSFASDLRGYLSADLKLKGTASKPVLTGSVKLQKTSFVIDYLNTRYSFSDNVTVTEEGFIFNNITVNDDNGRKAILNGRIYHNHFEDFGLHLDIHPDKFMCLNTKKSQNELFYGSAIASGVVTISGFFDNLSFDGTLTSEKGTHIYIPLSNPEEVGESGFITFISHDADSAKKIEAEPVDFSGINMDFTFEATPDAEIELVFDEKIGDIMKGTGSGTINMIIDQFGTFNMYGEYIVERGDYLFTLQNIINKRFDVAKGGFLKWNGSPSDAIIDLNANYKLRASLYDLLPEDTSLKKRTDVILNLSLKNKLMNPDVIFRIDIPNIDPTTESLVKSNISTQEDVNNQTLSLLVLNRFQPGRNTKGTANSGGSFEANASELLSNQLTNWAQSLTNAVDIGINYRAADKISSQELEVALSTKLFNDRLTLDGVVGVTGTNETTQQTSSIVGDFNADVQVSNNGRFHFKAFNRSNNNTFLNYFNSLYTQGIGIYYRQDFNTVGDLFRKKEKPQKNKPQDTSSTDGSK
ncbi:MAG TPA: translocation/assembly module TamB domain-containing protein [Bacteroidia bacterium]|nr:translocation/assembly module TamB domain-containing protein [Bacteroidia bacterium]